VEIMNYNDKYLYGISKATYTNEIDRFANPYRYSTTTDFDLKKMKLENELFEIFIYRFFNKNENSKDYVLYYDCTYSQFYLAKQITKGSFKFIKINKFV